MAFSDTAMMELDITQSTDIHNTRSLIRALKYVLEILQTEEALTVEEYKHTHTHNSKKKLQLPQRILKTGDWKIRIFQEPRLGCYQLPNFV